MSLNPCQLTGPIVNISEEFCCMIVSSHLFYVISNLLFESPKFYEIYSKKIQAAT